MSRHDVTVHGGMIVNVRVVRASSGHGVVAMGPCGVPMLCLQGRGRPELPSLLEAM
jgi:hypothetical protein